MKNLLIIFSVMLIFVSACQQSGSNQDKTGEVYDNVILVYNFHLTNRCPSCIAIEDATTKTLNTYFSEELKEGKIKQFIINVDESANSKIAEKYEAYGSGLRITKIENGKEQTIDLTAEGFKYARSKEDQFIEILKSKIDEFLK
ncbi:hypothetical protein EOL99_03385 [Candidatus Falkowbacteria bacterium]|nr:hypothetical protein [Candidatus Falkowbacteria bacterium]